MSSLIHIHIKPLVNKNPLIWNFIHLDEGLAKNISLSDQQPKKVYAQENVKIFK